MLNNLTASLKKYKLTTGLALIILLVVGGGWWAYSNYSASSSGLKGIPGQEVDITFEADGPFAILSPRRDGNAIVLNIKRVASYDAISYELAYSSEGIERGVVGNLNVDQKKGEYTQDVLFGTCSKNVCKYDTGVENGTLTLHIKKGDESFRMLIAWHMQQPDLVNGMLTSADNHFIYKLAGVTATASSKPVKRETTGTEQGTSEINAPGVGYTIINELTGVPKLPDNTTAVGKVYALNTPNDRALGSGDVTIELADKAPQGSAIYRYDAEKNGWTKLNTTGDSTLKATSDKGGIFAVLTTKS